MNPIALLGLMALCVCALVGITLVRCFGFHC
jgi:hypothetical protein